MSGPLAFSGTVWRAVFAGDDPLAPVRSPEGRFHHSGQWTVYGSLTGIGCAVGIARYLRSSDPPRVVVPLRVQARVLDRTGQPELSVVWQEIRAGGAVAPTWAVSDEARALGAQGMLYSARTHPDLTHLVLFDPSALLSAGKTVAFPGGETGPR